MYSFVLSRCGFTDSLQCANYSGPTAAAFSHCGEDEAKRYNGNVMTRQLFPGNIPQRTIRLTNSEPVVADSDMC